MLEVLTHYIIPVLVGIIFIAMVIAPVLLQSPACGPEPKTDNAPGKLVRLSGPSVEVTLYVENLWQNGCYMTSTHVKNGRRVTEMWLPANCTLRGMPESVTAEWLA